MESSRAISSPFNRNAWPALLAYPFLAFVYCSTFRVFATLPLEGLHQFISLTGIVLFTLYYVASFYFKTGAGRFTRLDMLLLAFLGINFFAAFRASVVFGQPILFGIIAQRSVLLALSGAMILSMLDKGWITLGQLERTFLFLAVALLTVSYGFVLFSDPKRFVDQEFVVYSPLRGYRFRFQFALVIMLFFYSLFRWRGRRSRFFLFSIFAILFYLVYFLQSRTTLAVLAITLLIYFFRSYSFSQRLKRILLVTAGVMVVVLSAYALDLTALLDRYRLLFTNATDVFRGVTPDEASSAIRYLELKTALGRIALHPFFGNGFVSSQWNGGWHRLLGYFYPVDIGLFGNLVVFGFIGTLVVYSPFAFAYRLSQNTPVQADFLRTCNYTLLFFFLTMFFSAVNIRDSSSVLFLVCIVYYYRYRFHEKPTAAPPAELDAIP